MQRTAKTRRPDNAAASERRGAGQGGPSGGCAREQGMRHSSSEAAAHTQTRSPFCAALRPRTSSSVDSRKSFSVTVLPGFTASKVKSVSARPARVGSDCASSGQLRAERAREGIQAGLREHGRQRGQPAAAGAERPLSAFCCSRNRRRQSARCSHRPCQKKGWPSAALTRAPTPAPSTQGTHRGGELARSTSSWCSAAGVVMKKPTLQCSTQVGLCGSRSRAVGAGWGGTGRAPPSATEPPPHDQPPGCASHL